MRASRVVQKGRFWTTGREVRWHSAGWGEGFRIASRCMGHYASAQMHRGRFTRNMFITGCVFTQVCIGDGDGRG